jgi:hypothetical protein
MLESRITNGFWIDYEQAMPPGSPEEANGGVYNGPVRGGQRQGLGTCAYPNRDFFKGLSRPVLSSNYIVAMRDTSHCLTNLLL